MFISLKCVGFFGSGLRLGALESGIIAFLIECGGYASYRDLRAGLCGRGQLSRREMGLAEYGKLRARCSSIARSCRNLERKGLVALEGSKRFGRLVRIHGVMLVWEAVGAELIRRTSSGRRILRSDR